MADEFADNIYKEISYRNSDLKNNVIKSGTFEIKGSTKVSVEEDSHEGVKIILKKDEHDNIKEIKFVCSCGETKSVLLDYSEE
ncbi:MAG: hypothetical protein V1720_01100 [bacterium]